MGVCECVCFFSCGWGGLMLEQCLKTDMETGSGRMVIADTAAAGGMKDLGVLGIRRNSFRK